MPKSAPSRKLHRGHFAFLRAVVQGVDVHSSWQRYLQHEGDGHDRRTISKAIAWMRDAFAAAARRHQRHGIARLVQIDATTVADGPPQPSLEDFVHERGLADFSESEQLDAYAAEYGGQTRRQGRRARLIAQQLDALHWLEARVAQPPAANDPVASWLHPDLATRLDAAGITTLAALAERINGIGKHWARGIAAIGAGKAARIVEWMQAHQDSIGIPIGPHVMTCPAALDSAQRRQIVAPATAVVPLEKFVLPPALDGSQGRYRAPPHLCLLAANNDFEAILAWVRSKRGLDPAQLAAARHKRHGAHPATPSPLDWLQTLSHTQRAYLKEAERFLLWSVLERGKPLSSMTVEDCAAYRAFVANPTPASRWCGPRARARWSPLWRPFEGPLSARAQQQAVTILRNLYGFLVDQAYLIGNPWSAVTVPRASRRTDSSRAFSADQWTFIEQQLTALPPTSAALRLRFALRLLYATGLRLSEVVSLTVDHLRYARYGQGATGGEGTVEGWEIEVVGKGGKTRTVPLPEDVVAELASYLGTRGLPANPIDAACAGAYLLGRASDIQQLAPWAPAARQAIDPRAGIAAGTLAKELKRFFAACSVAVGDPMAAARFAAASTHWLRHTHGTHAVASGVPIDVVQQNLGHASLGTTTVYVHAEGKRRMQAIHAFWTQRTRTPR